MANVELAEKLSSDCSTSGGSTYWRNSVVALNIVLNCILRNFSNSRRHLSQALRDVMFHKRLRHKMRASRSIVGTKHLYFAETTLSSASFSSTYGTDAAAFDLQQMSTALPAGSAFIELVSAFAWRPGIVDKSHPSHESDGFIALVMTADDPNAITIHDLMPRDEFPKACIKQSSDPKIQMDFLAEESKWLHRTHWEQYVSMLHKFVSDNTSDEVTRLLSGLHETSTLRSTPVTFEIPSDLAESSDPSIQETIRNLRDTQARIRRAHLRSLDPRLGGIDSCTSGLRSWIEDLLGAVASAKRLFIAPDGLFGLIPVSLLPSESGSLHSDEILLDKYEISFVGCASEILRFAKAETLSREKPMILAAPDFKLKQSTQAKNSQNDLRPTSARGDDSPWLRLARRMGLQFEPLGGASKEAFAVARNIESLNPQICLGKDATKQRLLNVRSPIILHIATHGFFLPFEADHLAELEDPLARTGLAFTGSQALLDSEREIDASEHGFVTAAEIAMLDLRGTELVVLSACESALGFAPDDEGLMNLGFSFFLAGAQTVIMSLWKVDDEVTSELMDLLYDCLRNGYGRSAALQTAQRSIKAKYVDPYYWAGFVCYGNPNPISSFDFN